LGDDPIIKNTAGRNDYEFRDAREELRGILGEKIKLRPDKSGSFFWAEYSLGLSVLLPRQSNADIVVAGGRFVNFRLSLAA
jgi:hypothetical protein